MSIYKLPLLALGIFTMLSVRAQQNALHFDGNDDKVTCGNDPSVQITGTSITLEAWIYANSWKSNVWEGCIIIKENLGPPGGYMLRAGANGQLNFEFGNGSSWVGLNSSNNVLSLNTWHHVAGSYDGTKMRIYVDGVPIDSMNTTAAIANTTDPLIIGDYPGGNRVWDGKIDEVRVWNVTRSKAEIQAAMDSTYCWAHNGLQAYYKFNQGMNGGSNPSVTTLYDLSGNGNDGTLSGFALTGTTSNWVDGASLVAPLGAPTSSVNLTVCEQFASPSGNYVWTTSGTYVDTLSTVLNQCDSIVTYNLTVNNGPTGQDSVRACTKYVSPYTNQTITASGTFVDSIPSPVGCDTLMTTQVTILNVASTAGLSDTVCSSVFSYTSPSGNYTWTSPGVYNDTVMLTNTCEAVTVFLTVYDPVVAINKTGITLETPGVTNASYQWVDCDAGYAPISGATSTSYTATANGNYAVIQTLGLCSDTSACESVIGVGISELDDQLFSIYPNPSNGVITIEDNVNLIGGILEVQDLTGRIIYSGTIRSSQTQLELNHAGLYLIYVSFGNKQQTERVIVQ